MVRGVARTAVVAGTATVVAGNVRHHQDQKWANQQAAQQQQTYEQAPPAAAPPPAAEDDVVEKLKELSSLKTAGVISEEEFEAAKAKLLG
jgi:hypothetical protein